MRQLTSTSWLKGACVLSMFLVGGSIGVLPQPSSAAPKLPPVQSLVVQYNILPGEVSENIPLAVNQPVFVMGSNTGVFTPGVAQVTMLHFVTDTTTNNEGLHWVGLEAPPSSSITGGFTTGGIGTHIVFLDSGFFGEHFVEIQTGPGHTIRVHNRSTVSQTGYVKLMW